MLTVSNLMITVFITHYINLNISINQWDTDIMAAIIHFLNISKWKFLVFHSSAIFQKYFDSDRLSDIPIRLTGHLTGRKDMNYVEQIAVETVKTLIPRCQRFWYHFSNTSNRFCYLKI